MRMLKVLGLDRTAGEILGLFSIENTSGDVQIILAMTNANPCSSCLL